LYNGTSDFEKGYQPRTNILNDENGDLIIDCYITFVTLMKYFSKLLNLHGVKDVRETEKHAAEPLVPEPCAF
jgi:hypothetical protein